MHKARQNHRSNCPTSNSLYSELASFDSGRSKVSRFVCYLYLLGLSVTLLPGCSLLQGIGLWPSDDAPKEAPAPPPPLSEQPYEFALVLRASTDVNLNSQQQPSPIRTRIFLTEPGNKLGDKKYTDIFEFDGNELDPAALHTITLQPGQIKRIKIEAMKSHNLLTIAAAYRDPFSVSWITSKTINTESAVRFTTDVNATAVTITAQ